VRSSRRLGEIFMYYVCSFACALSLKELDFIDTFVYSICLVCSYITFHFSLQHPFRTRNALLPKSVLPLLHTLPCLLLFVSCWVYVSNFMTSKIGTMIRIRIPCPYLISLSINPYQLESLQICLSRIYNLVLVPHYTLLLESL